MIIVILFVIKEAQMMHTFLLNNFYCVTYRTFASNLSFNLGEFKVLPCQIAAA